MSDSDDFWNMDMKDLVTETLPIAERNRGVEHAARARAVLQARLAMDATKDAANAAHSSAVAGRWVAAATGALVLIEAIRLSSEARRSW